MDIDFIKDELALHLQLQQRIDKRVQWKQEFEYYKEKLELMNKDRSYRASKGQTESISDEDKWSRNQNKCNSGVSTSKRKRLRSVET